MPTYEYECDECGHRFELFQQMTDEPARECPECGGKVRRLIGTGGGLILKGAGFHANDYGKPSCPASGNGKPSCCSGECQSDS
jgi:putative FmdB family regulatory protein